MMRIDRISTSIVGLFITVLAGASCGTTDGQLGSDEKYEALSPFGVSYEKISKEQASRYDLLIIEPSHYNRSEIESLKSTGATVLAYLSVGEVGTFRWYYSELEERGFLGRNENWNSYYINLADSVSYNLFFDEVIPDIMIRSFDGLFLDTVDAVASYTERKHLQPYMLKFIRQISTEHPEAMIVQNAGLFLLNETSSIIDAVLIEDIATHYNFESQTYTLKDSTRYKARINTIRELSNKHDMPFLLVDFATEPHLRKDAAQRLDTLAFPYFINNIELNNISTGITGNNY